MNTEEKRQKRLVANKERNAIARANESEEKRQKREEVGCYEGKKCLESQ